MTTLVRPWAWLRRRFTVLQLYFFALGVAFVLLLIVNTVAGSPAVPARSAPAAHAPFSTQVTYRVTDSAGSFSVTYSDLSGGTRQDTSASDFSQTIPVLVDQHPLATLLAQNGADHGSITCEIDVDGAAVKSATSSGPYAVVSCSAVVD